MAEAVLASLHPSPMSSSSLLFPIPPCPTPCPRSLPNGPAQQQVLCLYFPARDPIIMEYCNWERSQKRQEGEAERKAGQREKHGDQVPCGTRGDWEDSEEEPEAWFGWIGE